MRKTRFKIDPVYDFRLLGISSNAKSHRLAWEINETLKISLTKSRDLVITFVDQQQLTIINYKFETENGKVVLLKNREAGNDDSLVKFLIPEHPEFDYFLWIQETDTLNVDRIRKLMKDIRVIQYVVAIDPELLRSKDNLLF